MKRPPRPRRGIACRRFASGDRTNQAEQGLRPAFPPCCTAVGWTTCRNTLSERAPCTIDPTRRPPPRPPSLPSTPPMATTPKPSKPPRRPTGTTRAFEVDEADPKPKFYCLSMLPYPSGALHMGHVRNYTIGDVISRYQRMQRQERAAADGLGRVRPAGRKRGDQEQHRAGEVDVRQHRAHARAAEALGYAIDWSREFATCRPEYYVHEQRMFVRLFKQGPGVPQESGRELGSGRPDRARQRAGHRRPRLALRRAGREARDPAVVPARSPRTRRNCSTAWTRCRAGPTRSRPCSATGSAAREGLEIEFAVEGRSRADCITVFTTRPDTLMGVTFLSIAAEHPLALQAAATNPAARRIHRGDAGTAASPRPSSRRRKRAASTPASRDPSGHRRKRAGVGRQLRADGLRHRRGDGRARPRPARLGIRARSTSCRSRWYRRSIASVRTRPNARDPIDDSALDDAADARWRRGRREFSARSRPRTPTTAAGQFRRIRRPGLSRRVRCARRAARAQGRGARRVNFRLRDWGVSRQRYWGCPIPMIYCAKCGAVPVPEDSCRWCCPKTSSSWACSRRSRPIRNGARRRARNAAAPAERETDTFDTFMESSWYYARYTSPARRTWSTSARNYWLPVDQYIGGIEHAILHLLYFRFYPQADARRRAGAIATSRSTNLLCQGMVIAETFLPRGRADGSREHWINPADVEIQRDERARIDRREARTPTASRWRSAASRRCRSRRTTASIRRRWSDKYGADTVRLFSMFAAPPEQSLEWNEAGVEGMARFLRRLWRDVCTRSGDATPDRPARHAASADARDEGAAPPDRTRPSPRSPTTSAAAAVQHRDRGADGADERARRNSTTASDQGARRAPGSVHELDACCCSTRSRRTSATRCGRRSATPRPWSRTALAAGRPDRAACATRSSSPVQVNGKLRGTIEVPPSTRRRTKP